MTLKNAEEKLLEEIRNLLILLITKGKATHEEVGRCLGVGRTRITNILTGVGGKKNAKEE